MSERVLSVLLLFYATFSKKETTLHLQIFAGQELRGQFSPSFGTDGNK